MVNKYRPDVNWEAIAQGSETIVIYMGVRNLPNIIENLLQAGRAPDTPIALIRWGTRPDQEELLGSLGSIVKQVEQTGFEPQPWRWWEPSSTFSRFSLGAVPNPSPNNKAIAIFQGEDGDRYQRDVTSVRVNGRELAQF